MSWKLSGKCATDKKILQRVKEKEEDLFFDKNLINEAKFYCNGCVVRANCLQEGLQKPLPPGIWGGMSERERRKYLRNLEKKAAEIQERMKALLQDGQVPNAS